MEVESIGVQKEVARNMDICFSFCTVDTNVYSLFRLCPGSGRELLRARNLCQQFVQAVPESPVI
jgi:hypothetical protein